jgi:hypothetical protein
MSLKNLQSQSSTKIPHQISANHFASFDHSFDSIIIHHGNGYVGDAASRQNLIGAYTSYGF